MKIWQMKELSSQTYYSFSDELKLKMANNQFAFPKEQLREVRMWLIENANNPYFVTDIDKITGEHAWIKFVDEIDAIAFKLRWS